MSRKKKRSRDSWRQASPHIDGQDWLRALGLTLALAVFACAAAFLAPLLEPPEADLPVVISRVMSSNPAACFSVEGRYYDWLELTNLSGEPVSLKGWRLTKTADLRGGYVFDELALQPGEARIVYCDDPPENYEGSECFSGFRLSADGELLTLADARQRFASLTVPQLARTDIYQRREDGTYRAVPLAESLGGDERFLRSLRPDYDPAGLMISEVMPVNRTILRDADGDFSDWIELYNAGERAVDLTGYALSDNDSDHLKWPFPSRVVQPGERLVLFASGKDRRAEGEELHANFRLSGDGEALRLYDAGGRAISWVEYGAVSADVSLSRNESGEIVQDLPPSPGQENTGLGAQSAASAVSVNDLGLYINEVLTSGEGEDWLELANTSGQEIDLSGMGLSDDPAHPRKWRFPAGARIAVGGYVVVTLAGGEADSQSIAEDRAPADYVADFALSAGETACLSMPDGKLIDFIRTQELRRDVSVGRVEGVDRYRCFAEPTPGRPNAAASYEKVAREISFSVPPGIVREDRIELALTSDADVDIYYTTDGSQPTKASKLYDRPIALSKNTCIRAIAWRDGVLQSEEALASYIFGQHSLRLVCVTGNPGQLTGSEGMLNTGARKKGCGVFVEIYEPDGTRQIAQSCFFILSGHQSRTHFGQKSFRLTAKRAYGDTRFRAALFSNRDYDEYKSIVVRAGGQDVMQTKMRDSILTSLAADTRVLYQETEPCVVYVNGRYWGLYNLRERIDTHSICQFEGWSNPDGVTLGESTGNASYRRMLSWVAEHDLSNEANLAELRKVVDVENYLDYVALEMYTCNQDLNNIRYYRSSDEDPRWKWALFDLDLSFQIDRNNVKDWLRESKVGTVTSQDATLFCKLMKNSSLRDAFLTRMGQLLATTFSADNVLGKIRARYDLIREEMALNCKRWDWSTGTWNRYVKAMAKYASERPVKLAGYLQEAFGLSDAQARKYFGDLIA